MTEVTIEMPSGRAGMIAQFFEDEGLDVSWKESPTRTPARPPSRGREKRGWEAAGLVRDVVQVAYFLKANAASGVVGGASYALVQAAVKKIRERFPKLKVEVEDDDSTVDDGDI
jgi:hypothetical protein